MHLINIPVNKLAEYCDPFRDRIFDISKSDVRRAIKENILIKPSPKHAYGNSDDDGSGHAGRIAYLMTCTDQWKHISLDIGIPSLDYYPDWMVEDGNHRLAAAIMLKLKTIACHIGGELSYAEELFGIKILNKE